jgi:hypothetical protein
MIVKIPAQVSSLVLSYFIHSVLYDKFVPILAESTVKYLISLKTCFKTEGRGRRIAARICLLEQDLDVFGVDAVDLS